MSNKDRLGVPLNSSERAITIFQIFRQMNYAHFELKINKFQSILLNDERTKMHSTFHKELNSPFSTKYAGIKYTYL